jgi:tetratricopeptide (TPR) repeat protein
LLDEVWSSRAISESVLTRTVTELRQALGDRADAPRILETIPKRGYRLIAPVTVPATGAAAPARQMSGRSAVSGNVAGISLAVLALVAVLYYTGPGSAVRGLTAGRPAPIPFAARDYVLVAALENRTGESAFDDVLQQALTRELVGSGFVNVVPRPRIEDVLTLMKRPADRRLDAALAREVALRDGGIRAVLTGSIARIGAEYALTTEIVNPADGRVLANVTDHVTSSGDLPGRIRAQALRVREALGEALPSIERSRVALEKVTTPSLPALQLYSKAAALLEGDVWRGKPEAMGRYGTAEALLKKATEADPTFASAWFLLAFAICQQNRPDAECKPPVERAMALSPSMGPAERYLIEAYTHEQRYDPMSADRSELAEAARSYEALLQLVPDHYGALVELGWIYRLLGRHDNADRVRLEAFRIRPHSPRFAVDAAQIYAGRGDLALARAIVARVLTAEEHPEDRVVDAYDAIGWARLWEAHEAWLQKDVKRALEATRAAEAKWSDRPHPLWLVQLRTVYSGLGSYADALRIVERMGQGPPDQREWYLALTTLERERLDELRQQLQPERRNFDLLTKRLGLLVIAGWFRDAEWVNRERERRGIRQTWDMRADLGGQIFAAQGRYAAAIALMEPLQRINDRNRSNVDDALAVSRRGVGDLAGAIRGLELATDRRARAVTREDGWYVSGWLKRRMRLAEFYREAGRHAEADRVCAEIRALLGVADADHPLWARLAKVERSTNPN